MVLIGLALLSSAAVSAAEAATVGPGLVERLPTKTDCGGPWIYASACRDAHLLQQPFMCQVCRSWATLDRVVSAHMRNASNRSKLSGGLFLHEAQAARAIQLLQPIIKRNGAATVCETGFNAGHSTLLFLALAYADTRSSRSLRVRGSLRVPASCVRQRAAWPRGGMHGTRTSPGRADCTYRVSCGTTGAT